MSEKDEARKEAEQEPLFNEPEAPPQPSETPLKPKTRTELFTALLNQCPDLETAKARIGEFAEQLHVKKSLGYKAMRKTRFALETPETPRPEVPTVKIGEGEKVEVPVEETQEPQAPRPFGEAPRPLEAEAVPSPPTPEVTPTMEKIQPIFERSMARLINSTFEMVGAGKDVLDTQEAKDTATLMPILIYRITKVSLTEEQFIDVTLVTHFGSIVVKVVNRRMQQRKTKEEKPVKPPEPKPPEQRPPEKPPTQAELDEMKKHQQPPFLQHLS